MGTGTVYTGSCPVNTAVEVLLEIFAQGSPGVDTGSGLSDCGGDLSPVCVDFVPVSATRHDMRFQLRLRVDV